MGVLWLLSASKLPCSCSWYHPRGIAQVLHDAFFKHQTKPSLTPMGDLYYEGKEFEARVRACAATR